MPHIATGSESLAMDCKTVMAPIKTSLYTDELAGTVIDFMVEKHMGLIPVIERNGRFAGLVSGDSLMTHMLPRSVGTMSSLHSISYLHETTDDMRERLEEIRQKPIGDLVDRDVETARPDTPLIDALMLIKSKQYVVPVVDGDNKLLGAISFFSVLYALNENYDRENTEQAKKIEREERKGEKSQ